MPLGLFYLLGFVNRHVPGLCRELFKRLLTDICLWNLVESPWSLGWGRTWLFLELSHTLCSLEHWDSATDSSSELVSSSPRGRSLPAVDEMASWIVPQPVSRAHPAPGPGLRPHPFIPQILIECLIICARCSSRYEGQEGE